MDAGKLRHESVDSGILKANIKKMLYKTAALLFFYCDGTDVQADWRRSIYGRASNAIDILQLGFFNVSVLQRHGTIEREKDILKNAREVKRLKEYTLALRTKTVDPG